MAVDPALASMLSAITAKIQGLSAGNATAEDTALMGFAIEKIAGQISAMELQLLTDGLKAAITTLSTTGVAEVNAAATKGLADIAAKLTEILDTVTKAEADYNDNDATKTAAFNANAVSKTATFDANVVSKTATFDANAEARTEELVDDLLATYADQFTTPSTAGAVTVNTDGYFTSFTDGRGRTYSAMTYDTLYRLKTWRESITLPTGATAAFNYTATYVGTSSVPTITRVAA